MKNNKNKVSAMSYNVCSVNSFGYHASVKKYDDCGSRFFYIDKSLLSDRVERPRVRVIRDFGSGVCTICEGTALSLLVNGISRCVLLEDDRGSCFDSRGFTKLYMLHA